jgi:hypothetical protein
MTDTLDFPAMLALTGGENDLLFDDLSRATTIEAALLDLERELPSPASDRRETETPPPAADR